MRLFPSLAIVGTAAAVAATLRAVPGAFHPAPGSWALLTFAVAAFGGRTR